MTILWLRLQSNIQVWCPSKTRHQNNGFSTTGRPLATRLSYGCANVLQCLHFYMSVSSTKDVLLTNSPTWMTWGSWRSLLGFAGPEHHWSRWVLFWYQSGQSGTPASQVWPAVWRLDALQWATRRRSIVVIRRWNSLQMHSASPACYLKSSGRLHS